MYPKFINTVPKSHYMEIKISVNNNHIMKHLTLEDVTLTYKKQMTLLILHEIC